MTRWYPACVLGSLFSLQVAAGQDPWAGQRARVTLSPDSVQTGLLDSLSQNRLWLRSDDQPSIIPVGRIQLLELSRGREPELMKGLGLGVLGGAAVGAGLWLAFINGDPYEEMKGMWAAVFISSGAVGGGLAGIGLSLILAPERWEVVPLNRRAP